MTPIYRRLCALPLLVFSTGVLAQDSDDWDLGRDPDRKAVVAAVTYENFGVAVRCVDEQLSVLMSGLPQGRGERQISISMGDRPGEETTWISAGDGTTVFSLWPTSAANILRKGGQLNVILAAEGGQPVRRFAFDLPASAASVPAVFEACDKSRPTQVGDPSAPSRENLAGLRWVRKPEPRFPVGGNAIYSFGIAAITCTTNSDGYLRRCDIESEYPADAGFGRAAQFAAHQNSRVEVITGDVAAVEDRKINFIVRFGVLGGDLPITPSRLPDRSGG